MEGPEECPPTTGNPREHRWSSDPPQATPFQLSLFQWVPSSRNTRGRLFQSGGPPDLNAKYKTMYKDGQGRGVQKKALVEQGTGKKRRVERNGPAERPEGSPGLYCWRSTLGPPSRLTLSPPRA